MSKPATLDLSFINRDVTAQLDRSQEIVKVAESLNSVLSKIEDADAKAKVQESIKGLLSIVGDLTANANTTSANTVFAIANSKSS
jgi:hypothetical protein